ncbi:ABC transporter permease [Chryseolinea sp. H1M3-3]|uniref:ABC transporter permease n=1 Tax=Chryseolinea sp. H1M3-3 TaxID=3034144 RepID=UPI0023EB18F4|nr:ABC transporter permease [Chryseolinea sp. H1M3-3]
MATYPQPPKWAETLIERLAPEHLAEEIKGDLYEMFLTDMKRFNERNARRRYAWRVIGFLGKTFFWKGPTYQTQNMTGNYFKMAKRSLLANKGTTTINVLGLVIGIASALAIISIIRFELSFDTFHTDHQNIYRLVRVSGADLSEFRTGVPYAITPAMKDISSIKKMTKLEYLRGASVDVLSADGKFERQFIEEEGVVTVEPEFFDVIDFAGSPIKWISGDPKTSLREPSSLVITRTVAKKYFGDESPIGRTLRFQKVFDFKITGVIEDFPSNTDFPFRMLVSYASMPLLFKDRMSDWVSVNDGHAVYVVLHDGVEVKDVEAQIAKIHAANVGKDLAEYRHYFLQPLREVHFDPKFGTFSRRTITHETILALKLIVLCLLAVGCINYVNLSTAHSTMRSKEIGMRKIMGSTQGNLILQFLAETLIIVLVASFAALGLVAVFMPSLAAMLGLQVSINFSDPFLWITLALIIAIVTISAGLYPALLISRFNPLTAIKNRFAAGRVAGISLRKTLVVFQFTATQVLAVATFIVVAQMDFFRNVDMGFDRNAAVVTIRLLNNDQASLSSFESELRRLPFVENVAKSFTLPSGVDRNRNSRNIGKPEANDVQDFQNYEYSAIDENFLDLYGIRLIAGRNLTPADSSKNILVNEALMKNLGYTNPQDIVGAELKLGGDGLVHVVGVINDYYGNSLKERVDNIALDANADRYRQVSVRLNLAAGQNMTDVLTQLEQTWKSIYPEHVFQFRFLDDNIAMFYEQELKYSRLFQVFSTMFVLIGCLGLYGLITFVANRKGKEIAVRKTLGASVANIIVMFSREYIVLITVSFALAVPIAWYGVNEWLMNFENHIDVQWWLFAAPGAIVLAIALAVVCMKSFNAAIANPVDKLRNE